MISTVVVNFNEGEKLERCLESIKGFSDEVVVLDLGSKDQSEKISSNFGARFIKHKWEPFVEKVRNFAISQTKGEWVLILDPDESLPEKLKLKLKEISQTDKAVAVNIPRKNIFFGKWIAHTNWWPDKHIRFFKKDTVNWSDKIHSYPKVNGDIVELDADPDLAIIHYGYDNLSQFLERQNRYSTIEANQRFEGGEKFSWRNFFWLPIREFLVRFVKHQGFMDGSWGFILTGMMMVYQLQVMVKLWEKNRK